MELMRLHRLSQDRRGNLPASIERREIYLRAFVAFVRLLNRCYGKPLRKVSTIANGSRGPRLATRD
jgi:hypothetical protein